MQKRFHSANIAKRALLGAKLFTLVALALVVGRRRRGVVAAHCVKEHRSLLLSLALYDVCLDVGLFRTLMNGRRGGEMI